jgi:hypothetical protein
VSRVQSCVATHWEILLRPRVGEGRNNVLGRGWYVSPVSVADHDRFGSSVGIEEQKEKDRWSVHRLPTSGTLMIMTHVILYGSVSCRQSEELDDLPEHGPEGLTKRTLIRRGESAQFLEDEGWVDSGEDGFEQSRPPANPEPAPHPLRERRVVDW